MALAYRKEIDGLRALAVISVIFFHAEFGAFKGGFVGVDVFFVISGYLITRLIFEEMSESKFSIWTFYERRARRILPALITVVGLTIPFAWLVMPAPDLQNYSRSVISVLIFTSNIFFWRNTDYFESSSQSIPLLHTWSLAVEEQFYFLFPLFMLLTWFRGKKFLTVALVIGCLISLTLSQVASISHPLASFYLLPTRGWELLCGSLAAVFLSKSSRRRIGVLFGESLALFGCTLILYAIFRFDKSFLYQSAWTIVPTFGTILIIIFANESTVVGRIF